ncbi:unnamed protein product [Sphagnum jensenii]|uniref:Uncharacterized protein n=1 Tax=Sphagnum jensenii TaxID=128206 RepID=A0ABP0VA77_9BRYO
MAGMQTYNPFLTPTGNSKLAQIMLEQQLGQDETKQGLIPLDTNNRTVNGVGYRISPFEGLAKIAQALGGTYEQEKAIQDQQNLFNPQPTQDQAQAALDAQAQNPNAQQGPTVNASTMAQQLANTQNPYLSSADQSFMNDPVLANMAMSDPNDLSKIIATSRFAGYRPGESYVAANGQRMLVPTDQQQNFGASMPQYVFNQTHPGAVAADTAMGTNYANNAVPTTTPPMGMGGNNVMGAPQPPLPSPNAPPPSALPPAPAGMSNAPSPILGGSPPPPMPSQINPTPSAASNALVSSLPNVGQTNASVAAPAPVAAPLTPNPGESAASFKQRLDLAQKQAEANINVNTAGSKKQAEDEGANAAENFNQYIASRSNMQPVLDKINEMHQANKQSSFNALNTEDGAGPITAYHRLESDPVSQANAKLEQLKEQGLISQIGPQLAATGSKGNKLLEGIIQGSDSFKLNTGKPAVATSIDGLGLNYVRNQISQYDKAVDSGSNPPPMAPVLMQTPKGIGYVDPRHVGNVIDSGGTFDLSGSPIIVPKKASQ